MAFEIAPEVQDALREQRPVVALESTIIAHGMPHPQNLETAQALEQIIRDHGAVPNHDESVRVLRRVAVQVVDERTDARRVHPLGLGTATAPAGLIRFPPAGQAILIDRHFAGVVGVVAAHWHPLDFVMTSLPRLHEGREHCIQQCCIGAHTS